MDHGERDPVPILLGRYLDQRIKPFLLKRESKQGCSITVLDAKCAPTRVQSNEFSNRRWTVCWTGKPRAQEPTRRLDHSRRLVRIGIVSPTRMGFVRICNGSWISRRAEGWADQLMVVCLSDVIVGQCFEADSKLAGTHSTSLDDSTTWECPGYAFPRRG